MCGRAREWLEGSNLETRADRASVRVFVRVISLLPVLSLLSIQNAPV